MNIQSFYYEDLPVRTLKIKDQVYFVGKDVANILGYSNSRAAILTHVDDEDKGVTDYDTLGGKQNIVVINESGLYSLIIKSKLPNVKPFKRWVTNEVLPSIRQYGAYATPATIENIIANPDFGIKLLSNLKEEQERRMHAEQKLEEQKSKVLFAEMVETSKSSVSVKVLATILKQNGIDIGQNKLFEWLRNNGYLSSRHGKSWNMPTQRAMNQGLFELKPNTYFHSDCTPDTAYTTLVTGKGQIFFTNKFKKKELIL